MDDFHGRHICIISKVIFVVQVYQSCFNDISVNANLIIATLKSKRQHISTLTFYLRDISTPLVGAGICFDKVAIIAIYIRFTSVTF